VGRLAVPPPPPLSINNNNNQPAPLTLSQTLNITVLAASASSQACGFNWMSRRPMLDRGNVSSSSRRRSSHNSPFLLAFVRGVARWTLGTSVAGMTCIRPGII
jgi:hypothetical protein